MVQKVKGFNFPVWYKEKYKLPTTIYSFDDIRDLYPNLIGIIPTLHQDSLKTTDIKQTDSTATDEDLRYIIQQAHILGYQVMLKPHVILSKDPVETNWHGLIGQKYTEAQWKSWFTSFRQMSNHYAYLAQETGVELFVVGNELRYAAVNKPTEWVETVQQVRQRYSGPLTYAGHMEDFQTLNWWSELDFLGLNPYFRLSNNQRPSLQELQTKWKSIASQIETTAKKWNKKLLFPEIGYPSLKGSAYQPYNFSRIDEAPVDVQQQANCFQAMYEAVWNKDWMKGIVVWDWNADPNIGGLKDGDYTVKGKPAAKIITKYHTQN